jgi:F-type H+-transporting ATPase subunit b
MESIITNFHIDWKIIIAQTINFGIVFLVLFFFAIRPLRKIMDERENIISKSLLDAKSNEELFSRTKKEYDNIIHKAKLEAHGIFQESKKDAENKKMEIIENTKMEVEKMMLDGKKNLEIEKQKMINEAKTEIVSLVVKATEKILEAQDNKDFKSDFNNIKNLK